MGPGRSLPTKKSIQQLTTTARASSSSPSGGEQRVTATEPWWSTTRGLLRPETPRTRCWWRPIAPLPLHPCREAASAFHGGAATTGAGGGCEGHLAFTTSGIDPALMVLVTAAGAPLLAVTLLPQLRLHDDPYVGSIAAGRGGKLPEFIRSDRPPLVGGLWLAHLARLALVSPIPGQPGLISPLGRLKGGR
jgi:hypothetical protein